MGVAHIHECCHTGRSFKAAIDLQAIKLDTRALQISNRRILGKGELHDLYVDGVCALVPLATYQNS